MRFEATSEPTGQTCQHTGLYRCETCGAIIPIAKPNPFPPCPAEHRAVTWILVRRAD